MNNIRKRIVSLLCAVCLMTSSVGDLGLVALARGTDGELVRDLTASDGNTYRITVRCGQEADIPEDAELEVREIAEGESGYADYLQQSAETLGTVSEMLTYAKAFDISLRSGKTGEEYQPDGSVQVSIQLLDMTGTEDVPLDVVHFAEAHDGAAAPDEAAAPLGTPELLAAQTAGDTVTFAAESFSIYVVLKHSGDAVPENPQVEFHYLSHNYTAGAGGTYTAGPYRFLNTSENYQSSQILVDGQGLEMVSNPPNKTAAGQPTEYFFGWYLVEASDVADDGTATYRWTADPEQIFTEKPITITVDGGSIKWTMNGVEHTSPMDSLGRAHVYLAPIYEDYYFVNFHMGPEGSSKATNIVARKLVVLGSDNQADIVINDITAPTDSSFEIFTGWKPGGSDSAYTTVNSSGEPVGNQPDGSYTITLTNANFATSQGYELYPVFTDARWIFFNTGARGNGATYVGAQWSFTSDRADYPYVKNGGRLPVSRRNGYIFKGWYASQTNGNGSGRQITDEAGWFVNEAASGTGWKIVPGTEHGTLYLYEALDQTLGLTLYARWEAITATTYSVIIWRQSINDSPYAADSQKTYDFAASVKDISGTTGQTLGDLDISAYTGYSGSGDYEGFTYRTAKMSTDTVASDGSTVVNVYYDRNKHTLNFYDQVTAYDYNETTADTPTTQYAFVDGAWTQLQRQELPTSYTYSYGPVYTETDADDEGLYGVLNGDYTGLTRTEVTAPGYTYKQFDPNSLDEPETQYRLIDGEYAPLTRVTTSEIVWTPEYVYTPLANNDDTQPQYGIYQGEYYLLTKNINYTYESTTASYAQQPVQYGYRNGEYILLYYRQSNGRWYRNSNYLNAYNGTRYLRIENVSWSRDTYAVHEPATSGWGTNDTNAYHDYYILENGYYTLHSLQWYESFWAGSSYWHDSDNTNYGDTAYERTSTAAYTGTRYSRAAGETPYTGSDRLFRSDTAPYTYTGVNGSVDGTQYYVDANGGHVLLNRSGESGYEWQYQGEAYGGARYVQTDTDAVYNGRLYLKDGGVYTETSEDGDGRWGVDPRGGHVALTREPVFDHYAYIITASGADYDGARYARGANTANYTGTRYKLNGSTYEETEDATGTLYGKDANGVYRLLTVTAGDVEYIWYLNGTDTVWNGTRYERSATQTNGWRLVYVMEALYHQSLAAQFDQLGATYNNGERWMPQKKTYFQQVLVFLDIMPDEDEDFRKNTSTNGLKTLNYYTEVLPGEAYDTERNGKQFKLYHTTSARYGYFTETEDFLDILGFTKHEANPAYVNGELRNQNSISHYYARNSYNFTFVYNYPTVAGTTIGGAELTNEQLNKESVQSVPFGAQLSTYSDLSSFAPDESEIPDGYVFSGWYIDDVGSNSFRFTGTMPANHLRVFAKWDTLRYRVEADPAGGVLDAIDHRTSAMSGYFADVYDGDQLVTEGLKLFRPELNSYQSSYSTYTNIRFGRTWSLDPELKREYIPISDETAEALGLTDDEIFYYVNTQYRTDDGSTGIPSYVRNALYITQTELNYREPENETAPYTYWEFYRSMLHFNLQPAYASLFPGIQNHPYDYYAWLDAYVEKQDDGTPQKYRRVNPGETYTFIGWYPVLVDSETGEEYLDSMPYDEASPITGNTKVRAVWRLDGSYQIQYHPDTYLQIDDDTTVYINGTMPFWFDPAETDNTQPKYTDQATTNIYRQPNDIMVDGTAIDDDRYIFLGWQLVTPSGDGSFTPVASVPPYSPGDPFTIEAKYADTTQVIHLQAVYQKKSDSARRASISGLSLDANEENYAGAHLIDAALPAWDGVGTSTKGASQRIDFKDLQANDVVELFRYATNVESGGETGTNYFVHQSGYALIGFHEQGDPALNKYVPRFSADGVIAAPRGETSDVLYTVWEPMVYINFTNDTDKNDFGFAGKDITFSMTADNLQTLYVVNERTGAFTRAPYEDLSSIEVKVGETLRLAIPYGNDENITINGTNQQGTGILLTTTTTKKVGDNAVILHDPVETRNGKPFTDTATLITDAEGLTVTFTVKKSDYTMLFKDNYNGDGTGGSEEEFYYKATDIDGNDAFLSEKMPRRGRVGYNFLGWALTPDATEAIYDMDQQIDHLKGFFDTNDMNDGVEDSIVPLYGVWESDAERGQLKVQKSIPTPGNPAATFNFTVSLSGNARRGSSYGNETISAADQTFTLTNDQYIFLKEEQWPANNSGTDKLRVRVTMQVYNYKENADDEAVGSPVTVTWSSQYNNNYATLDPKITIVETGTGNAAVGLDKYDTTLALAPGAIQPAGSNNDTLTVDSATRTVTWDNPANSGGTALVTNQRKTANITVAKNLVNDPFETIRSFPITAAVSKLDSGEQYTVDPASFSVFNADEGRVTLSGIPTGSTLTLTETSESAFITTAASAGNASDLDDAGNVFKFVVSEDDTVTFTNTMIQVPVKIILRGYDGENWYDKVEARFSLYESNQQLYRPVDNKLLGSATNVIYEGNLAVGEYTLNQSWIQLEGYMKLVSDGKVAVSVTPEGVEIHSPAVYKCEKVDGVWQIWVINWKTVNIRLVKDLVDPLNERPTFTFKLAASFGGNAFDLGEDTVTLGGGGSRSATVPVGAEVTVRETGVTNYTTTAFSVQDAQGDNFDDSTNTYTLTIPTTGETVTFRNVRNTVPVVVKKTLTDLDDDTNVFTLTAKLTLNGNAIGDYTLWDDGDGVDEPGVDLITGTSSGEATFELTRNGTRELTIPVGVRLMVSETAARTSGATPEAVDLEEYATTASAVYTEGGASYGTAANYVEASRRYIVANVPNKGLTITFNNSPGGVEVSFTKIDGFGLTTDTANNTAIQFAVYTTYEQASAGAAAGRVTLRVGEDDVTLVSPGNSGVVDFKVKTGVYYLREVATDTARYQANTKVYQLAVGKSGADTIGFAFPFTGGADFLIRQMSDSSTTLTVPDIAAYGILNESKTTREVILKKIDDTTFAALEGAVFNILRADESLYDTTGEYDVNGVFYIGDMPAGKYFLVETTAPAGYAARTFTLTVPLSGTASVAVGKR